MKCTLCGFEFRKQEGAKQCRGCPMNHGCSMVRCPACGYEIPLEPAWLARLRALMGRTKRDDTE